MEPKLERIERERVADGDDQLAVEQEAILLQARKHLENWPGWIVANVAAIGVFFTKDLPLFAGLYAVFLGLAVWGWRDWARAMRAEGAA